MEKMEDTDEFIERIKKKQAINDEKAGKVIGVWNGAEIKPAREKAPEVPKLTPLEDEGKVAIGTTLPRSVYDEIKEKRLHYNELIIRGLDAVNKNPGIMTRLDELEVGNQKLQHKLTDFYQKLFELGKKTK